MIHSKKYIFLSTLTYIVTGLFNTTYAADTLEKIKKTGKIIIGHSDSAEPISYIANGKPVGYALDICHNVAKEIEKELKIPNLKIEYKTVSSANRIPEIVAGNIDMDCDTTTNTKERQEKVGFSINYFAAEIRIAVKKDSSIKDINDLDKELVATTKGTTSERHIAQNEKGRNIQMIKSFGKTHAETFSMLSSGSATAVIQNGAILHSLIAKSAHPQDYKIVGTPLAVEPYGIILAKDDTKIKTIADSVILNMWKSGQMDQLYKKWFQSPIPPNNINLNMPPSDIFKYLKTHTNNSSIIL